MPTTPSSEASAWPSKLPDGHQDCRLTLHNGQYHLAVTFRAKRRKSETQARVVALDPGIRTFLTWFSETDAGQIGKHDFGRIQRLCHHLDQLISRTAKDRQSATSGRPRTA